jgi:predicted nucleotidyltransferase
MIKQKEDKSRPVGEALIHRLKNINHQLSKDFGVSRIGIFGSYARGEQNKDSDIDVLVEFHRPVNLFEFSRLKSFLTNQLGIQVDLVTPGALKPLIKDEILRSVSYI